MPAKKKTSTTELTAAEKTADKFLPAEMGRTITVPKVEIANPDPTISHHFYTRLSGNESVQVEAASKMDLPIVQALAAKLKMTPYVWFVDKGHVSIIMTNGQKHVFDLLEK